MKTEKSKKASLTLHTLKAAQTTKNRKRLGRGESSGTGKTAGRGQKGQKSRSGGGVRPGFEGGQMPLFRRIPKFHRSRRRLGTSLVTVVNTKAFKRLSKTQVTVETLYQAGLVRSPSAVVKILGDGDVDRAYQVQVQQISVVAQKKILAAGGQVELLK